MSILQTSISQAQPVERAVALIYTQHRRCTWALSALLVTTDAMLHDVSQAGCLRVDALLHYLRDFYYAVHHLAEEDTLLAPLLLIENDVGSVAIAQRTHITGNEQLAALERAFRCMLMAFSAHTQKTAAVMALRVQVGQYVAFEFEHIAHEENVILPLAVENLSPTDWVAIAKAFENHHDPLHGSSPSTAFAVLADLGLDMPTAQS
jgi:hemerythrin-like domain-containing protein